MYKKIETEGWKVSNPFKIATSVSMLDIVTDEDEEREDRVFRTQTPQRSGARLLRSRVSARTRKKF